MTATRPFAGQPISIAPYGHASRHSAAGGAGVGVDDRDERVELGEALLEDDRALGHRGQAGGDALARVLRPLAGAGDVDAVDHGLDRPELGVDLVEEAVACPTGSLRTPTSSSFWRGIMPVTRTTRSAGMASSSAAGQQVADGHEQPAGVAPRHRRRSVVGELQVDRPELARLRVHRLVPAVRAHVAVQVVLVDLRVTRGELDRGRDRRRTAVAGAVLVGARLAGRLAAADAVDVGDAADRPSVMDERAVGRVDERLELGQGQHAVDAVAVLADLRARTCRSRW